MGQKAGSATYIVKSKEANMLGVIDTPKIYKNLRKAERAATTGLYAIGRMTNKLTEIALLTEHSIESAIAKQSRYYADANSIVYLSDEPFYAFRVHNYPVEGEKDFVNEDVLRLGELMGLHRDVLSIDHWLYRGVITLQPPRAYMYPMAARFAMLDLVSCVPMGTSLEESSHMLTDEIYGAFASIIDKIERRMDTEDHELFDRYVQTILDNE